MPKIKFDYEQIHMLEGKETITYRAKVFNGWVVLTIVDPSRAYPSTTMTYIPDENHDWKIKD